MVNIIDKYTNEKKTICTLEQKILNASTTENPTKTTKITALISFTSVKLQDNVNPLMPNDHYSGRTAPLTSKHFILYIYSKNTCTEYFKHGIYSPFFSLQNAVCFIIVTYLVPILFTFYIQGVLKFKKIIPAPKG